MTTNLIAEVTAPSREVALRRPAEILVVIDEAHQTRTLTPDQIRELTYAAQRAMSERAASQVNPHTVPTVITALFLIPTAAAAIHSATSAYFNIAIGAVIAAIFAFMFNLFRHHAFEEAEQQ